MKTKFIKVLVVASALFLLATAHALAQSVPKLINYQGKLTDDNGNPLPNGTYGIAFRVWSKKAATEAGDQLIWGQEYNVAVANGVFNVILGAPGGTAVPGPAVNDLGYAFGEFNRFIGLTVTRSNGTAIPSATEIIPRQQVLASPYALNSANGCPVGGVIMWWGDLGSIPEGFELCDGQAPSSPGAVLGGSKPDLRDRFPKGATAGAANVKLSPVAGGNHSIGDRQSSGTALTINQMPNHSHGINDPGHNHGILAEQTTNGDEDNRVANGSGPIAPSILTDTKVTGITILSAGGGQAHDHTIPAHDNRPAFLEMFFIIRVK